VFSVPSGVLDVTYSDTIDANRFIRAESFTNANRSFGFSTAAGDSISGGSFAGIALDLAQNSAQTALSVAVDPFGQGWDYQSFGIWLTESIVGTAGSGSLGASSVGKTTNGDLIPTSGSATFSGKVVAHYVNSAGAADLGFSSVTLNTDFGQRSVSFSSPDLVLGSGSTASGTAMTGVLTYGSQQNALSGTLSTARLSGSAQGQFYGPSAQEIGGVFILTPTSGTGSERIIGGFGGKRP
jgi:hypothetical protein